MQTMIPTMTNTSTNPKNGKTRHTTTVTGRRRTLD
jgi:hypothetical protein